MRVLNVEFTIRKGLGPDTFIKVITVGLDDLDPEISDTEVRSMAIWEAERELYRSEDYHLYGKNWILNEVHEG